MATAPALDFLSPDSSILYHWGLASAPGGPQPHFLCHPGQTQGYSPYWGRCLGSQNPECVLGGRGHRHSVDVSGPTDFLSGNRR